MGDFEEKLNNILSSPADMERIMQLARSLSSSDGGTKNSDGQTPGGSQPPPKATETAGNSSSGSPFSGLDPKLLAMLGRIAGEYASKGKSDKSALFEPFRPYLKDGQRSAIDKALEISKLAKLARLAFSEFSGGDSNL